MSARMTGLLAAGASAALLAAALGFQYLGGLAPCQLCLWQRWPHAGAALLGVALLILPGARVPLAALGTLTMVAGAGLGGYHAGVEWGFWAGPSACAGGAGVAGQSAEALLAQIMAAPVVRCDEVAWSLLGLSMAGWNALASAGLAGLWLLALGRARA